LFSVAMAGRECSLSRVKGKTLLFCLFQLE
jgi:hypothetical protein